MMIYSFFYIFSYNTINMSICFFHNIQNQINDSKNINSMDNILSSFMQSDPKDSLLF